MKDTSIFEINSQNMLLNHIYRQDNIRVIDGMADNKKCIIICSSNGIYFPNTYEEFRTKIICNNLFDGGRISSLLIECVKRIILIRDIRKNFYVTGISEKYNSIDSVLCMLEELTDGYKVICGGGSAGGYMATIVGSRLNAQYVINAGGQWNLYDCNDVLERYYFLKEEYYNSACNKWFDLRRELRDNKVPIFYMYGALNESDINQARYAMGINNIYPIALKSSAHAQSVSTEPYLRLLSSSQEEIFKIYNKNEGNVVDVDVLEDEINSTIRLPKELSEKYEGKRKKWFLATKTDVLRCYNEILAKWVAMEQKNRNIIDELLEKGISTVAIWGKGKICDLLLNELNGKIDVRYIIESRPLVSEYKGIEVTSIEKIVSEIQLIIVIPVYDMEKIMEKIKGTRVKAEVVGIDELIQ